MKAVSTVMGIVFLSGLGMSADLCQIRTPDVAAFEGGEVVVPVLLTADFPVEGFSFGLVHAAGRLTPVEVSAGAAVRGLLGEQEPFFEHASLFAAAITCAEETVQGAAYACIPAMNPQITIATGQDAEIATIRYAAEAAGDTVLSFTDCLGEPPVALRIVWNLGSPAEGCQWQGSTVSAVTPAARLTLSDGDEVLPGAAFTREVLLDNTLESGVGGLEFAVAFTGKVVALTAIDYDGCAAMEGLDGGAGPDFFEVTLQAGGWSCDSQNVQGGAVACVVDDAWTETIPAGSGIAIARLSFTANEEGIAGSTALTIPTEGCIPAGRAPRVRFAESVAVTPELRGTTVVVRAARFVRSDANQDTHVDIADAVAILGYLFSHKELSCLDSGDANTDGAIDIADAIFTLGYLFGHGPDPQAPFPGCGLAAEQKLGCAAFKGCAQ